MDTSKVSQIKKGITTRAEVEAMFGPPAYVGMMGNGKRMLQYSYSSTESHAKAESFIPIVGLAVGGAQAQTRMQTLQIVLNSSNIVEDFEFNDGTSNINQSGSPAIGVMKTTTTSGTPAATAEDKKQ